jgi:hypothetical protein
MNPEKSILIHPWPIFLSRERMPKVRQHAHIQGEITWNDETVEKDEALTIIAIIILLFSAMITWTSTSLLILLGVIVILFAWYLKKWCWRIREETGVRGWFMLDKHNIVLDKTNIWIASMAIPRTGSVTGKDEIPPSRSLSPPPNRPFPDYS